jgi:hypothetical protein
MDVAAVMEETSMVAFTITTDMAVTSLIPMAIAMDVGMWRTLPAQMALARVEAVMAMIIGMEAPEVIKVAEITSIRQCHRNRLGLARKTRA